ncbi:MAG: hypothetical protein H6942_12455 [Candidatus Accumulibacter sp.]|uniref:hypothetical protein n=1 Tax=Accumulibacter sp. TaxID=2053492 RepID=UPI0025D2D229|nr:hypothetical protein [Accumulibacter sp.]MCP5249323.1 hypothetical protein [Accumulibacter sp.]
MMRSLALFCSLFTALAMAPAHALDAGTVQGHLQYDKQRHELRHALAVPDPYNSQRLWVLLTTAEISARDASDPARALKLAMDGKLRGVRLSVDAAAPQAKELQGALLLSKEESPGGEIVFAAGGEKFWERLATGDKRVVGTLHYAKEPTVSGSPGWAIDVKFSAPVFAK